jgi:osmotically-inducible protein OsmY
MTNETLERNVADELWRDPKIESEAIAVSADNGVNNRLDVRSPKTAAVASAWSAPGVITVDDRLKVNY